MPVNSSANRLFPIRLTEGDGGRYLWLLTNTDKEDAVKSGIHPEYVEAIVTCACGETWRTRSTKREIHLEICSACHPFFTGKQKYVDSAGRVERFQKKYRESSKKTGKG